MAAPAKRIKIQWGQVALAVASHHGVVVQELIRISLDPPPGEGGGGLDRLEGKRTKCHTAANLSFPI